MALYEESVRSGQWLFQRRTYLPVFALALTFSQVRPVGVPGDQPSVPLAWPLTCFVISLIGLAIRAYTVGHAAPGTSGRGRAELVADTLNTTGAYSLVRHPLYLGNFIGWLGPALVPRNGWLAAVLGLAFCLYYERIMFAEEAFLRGRHGQAFLDWAARTPAFLPDPRRWSRPAAAFNLRVVLRREYSGLLQLVFVFAGLNAAQWWVSYQVWRLDPFWAAALVAGTLLTATLRLLRRYFRALEDAPPADGGGGVKNEMAGPTESDRP
jgi:protein-S-isoprenylcysteine O-methyltransferase Ste14